jgi:hypothetical protein
MEDPNALATSIATVATALVEAIRDNRLDEAEVMLEELNTLDPDTEEHLIFPVLIAIQRGYITEALQYLNGLGEDAHPELKALCLNILGDPTWHYHANTALQSEDSYVREAMEELLEIAPEPEEVAA